MSMVSYSGVKLKLKGAVISPTASTRLLRLSDTANAEDANHFELYPTGTRSSDQGRSSYTLRGTAFVRTALLSKLGAD